MTVRNTLWCFLLLMFLSKLSNMAVSDHSGQIPKQTFGRVGVFIPKPDLAHVTISTTREENGLKIFVAGAANQGKHLEDFNFTRNVGLACKTFAIKYCD